MLTTAYMHVAHWSSSTPCVLQASSDQNTLLQPPGMHATAKLV